MSLPAAPLATSFQEAPGRMAVRAPLRAALVTVSLTISARLISHMPTMKTQKITAPKANSTAAAASRRGRLFCGCCMSMSSHGVPPKRVLAGELGVAGQVVGEGQPGNLTEVHLHLHGDLGPLGVFSEVARAGLLDGAGGRRQVGRV